MNIVSPIIHFDLKGPRKKFKENIPLDSSKGTLLILLYLVHGQLIGFKDNKFENIINLDKLRLVFYEGFIYLLLR